MKIIGSAGDSKFILEANEYEIANIMGFDYPREAREKKQEIAVGRDVQVSPLWKALSVSRARMKEIAELANGLRKKADQVDSINTALAEPIVEVKVC